MEKQKLPNATAVLILGILSILTCCCWGFGLILGIVALRLAKKDAALFFENPELYEGYSSISTGKVLSIIGIILSGIYFIFTVYLKVNFTDEELKGIQENLIEKMKHQQEME